MDTRVGRVTSVEAGTGRVKVAYDDTGSSSLNLAMLTMNNEYSMPAVGDRVVTIHLQNGSSKGFVLGTYYGGGTAPNANTGYRKDYDGTCYLTCIGGAYVLVTGTASIKGDETALNGGGAVLNLSGSASLTGEEVLIAYGAAATGDSETATGDSEETEAEVYVKLTEELLELMGKTGVEITATEGSVEITAEEAEAVLKLDELSEFQAQNFEGTVEEDASFGAQNISIGASEDGKLTCSYGYVGFEELIKRLERLEDQFGLDHDTYK